MLTVKADTFTAEVTASSLYVRTAKLSLWIERHPSRPCVWSTVREPGSVEAWAGRVYGVVEWGRAAASLPIHT